MKKLLLLILLICCTILVNAQPLTRAAVAQAIAHALKDGDTQGPNSSVSQDRYSQILKAIRNETVHTPKQRDWTYFLEQNRQTQQQLQTDQENNLRYCYHLYDTDCGAFTKQLGRYFWGTFRPDYAKETKGIKYIYVTDASYHETKTIPAEVVRLMQDVRRANPNAHILLATEFALQTDPQAVPLRFANSSERPFQISGDSYTPLLEAGDRLHIDILGLDSNGVYPGFEGSIKIGDTIIGSPFEDTRIQRVLTQYNPEAKQIFTLYLEYQDWLNQFQSVFELAKANPTRASQHFQTWEDFSKFMEMYPEIENITNLLGPIFSPVYGIS